MPVLLLAQGDPDAKDLLRRTIEARYALSPPAIDSLQLDMIGRVRGKVGPVMAWVPVRIRARFRFPTAVRWDFSVRPVGVPVRHGIEAFDGTVYRQKRGRRAEIIEDAEMIHSLRHRLWAMAAVLLTPLGEHFVRVQTTGEASFEATNTTLGDTVQLFLRPDNTLEKVQVQCLNPDAGEVQRFSLRLSEEQAPVDDIMLPRRLHAFWNDAPYYEVEPVSVVNCTTLADEIFTLEADMELDG